MRSLVILSLVLFPAALVTACVSPATHFEPYPSCQGARIASERSVECLSDPQAQAYLQGARQRILDAWRLPRTWANQEVKLRFQLDRGGKVQCITLLRSSTGRFAESIASAIRKSDPLPPIPDEAACLAGAPLISTFSNPVK